MRCSDFLIAQIQHRKHLEVDDTGERSQAAMLRSAEKRRGGRGKTLSSDKVKESTRRTAQKKTAQTMARGLPLTNYFYLLFPSPLTEKTHQERDRSRPGAAAPPPPLPPYSFFGGSLSCYTFCPMHSIVRILSSSCSVHVAC